MTDSEPEDGDSGPSSRPSLTYSLHVGGVIADKYRLVEHLGEGGMASVWRAHNELLDVDVAIKFIRADLAHPGLTSRLLQEARAAARIEHPGIVRVSDFGKTKAGDPFIVMELLRGRDLGEVLRGGQPLDPVRAVQTLLPIANALVVAHGKGIVHRDLKPDNVYLAEQDEGRVQPKLVDFGIAKLEKPNEARLTQAGHAMGSPAYMAPEQARGKDVDARADIWSFTVMLYECITGKLPFDGNTQAALVCAILEGDATPLAEFGISDSALQAIVDRGLRKNPEERWQSMRELGGALARWLHAKNARTDISGNPLATTWDEYPAHSVKVGTKDFSETDAEVRTAVATEVSFGHHDSRSTKSDRSRPLLILGAIAGGVVLVGTVLFIALRRGQEPNPQPVQAAPSVATVAPVVATVPPVVSAQPTAEQIPPPSPSAVPSATAPASAMVPAPVATKPKPPAVRVLPKTEPKPKPAAPVSKPKPNELEIKTTL
ncbi:MAG: protein kinase [Polyangiaceae bacterium]